MKLADANRILFRFMKIPCQIYVVFMQFQALKFKDRPNIQKKINKENT